MISLHAWYSYTCCHPSYLVCYPFIFINIPLTSSLSMIMMFLYAWYSYTCSYAAYLLAVNLSMSLLFLMLMSLLLPCFGTKICGWLMCLWFVCLKLTVMTLVHAWNFFPWCHKFSPTLLLTALNFRQCYNTLIMVYSIYGFSFLQPGEPYFTYYLNYHYDKTIALNC